MVSASRWFIEITDMQREFLSLFDASFDSQKLILSIFKELSNHSKPGDMWTRLIPHIDDLIKVQKLKLYMRQKVCIIKKKQSIFSLNGAKEF